jgi:hypothetical protein
VLARIPGLEESREALEAAEREQDFWRDHYGELLQQFPDHFVAVREGAVVATNPDLQQLLESLKHQGIEFLATDPRRLMP